MASSGEPPRCGRPATRAGPLFPPRGGDVKKKHPGFEKVAESIAQRQGFSKERASKILASRTRKASPAAKRSNPRLKRVKMPA